MDKLMINFREVIKTIMIKANKKRFKLKYPSEINQHWQLTDNKIINSSLKVRSMETCHSKISNFINAGYQKKRNCKQNLHLKYKSVPIVLNGLGYVVIRTSAGIYVDKEVMNKRIGGEVLYWH